MAAENKKFEDYISELENLIKEVENGSMPLEQMVERISEGCKIIKTCRQRLDKLNSKVEILFKDNGNTGEFAEFDTASERAQAAKGSQAATEKKVNQQDDLPF